MAFRLARSPSRLFWAEAPLAVLSTLLLVLTLVTREWIEVLFGIDPDGGDGSLEWLVVTGLALATGTLFLLARAEWRKAPLAASGSNA